MPPGNSQPPGPRPRLVAAHAHRLLHDPVGFMDAQRRRYGPVFRLKLLGGPHVAYAATAELAEKVYGLDAGGGRAGEVRRVVLEPVLGRYSLLSLDHEPWWRHRRLLSPPLHGRAIAGYQDQISDIAAASVDGWPLGEPFALRDKTQEITLEVILRVVFGIEDARRLERMRALLPELLESTGSPLAMLLPPRLRDRMLASRTLRSLGFPRMMRVPVLLEKVNRILYAEIERRRSAPDHGATDVLSRLVAARDEDGKPLTDAELRDELITMLAAGHETTATALAWTFERLTRAPRQLARLREEIAAGEDGYLEAVIKEALRLRPAVAEAPRLVDEPFELGDYRIPAGWLAAPAISLIHLDPSVYPNPYEFRPERWLEGRDEPDPKWWQPFGGGRRYCVGAQLALLEMRVIIKEVLARLDLRAPDPKPEGQRIKHVTLVPAHHTRVVASPAQAGLREAPLQK